MSSIPQTSDHDDEQPTGGRPNWLLSVLMVLVCLGVVASGWGVARLAVGDAPRPLDVVAGPSAQPPGTGASPAEADPEDAEAYVALAVELVEASSAFHITFTVDDGASGPRDARETVSGGERSPSAMAAIRPAAGTDTVVAGRGQAVYDSRAEPEFEHHFTTVDDRTVYRYDFGDGQFRMIADRGLESLDPPSAADRYLCSPTYGSAKLREVLATSTDLVLDGLEEVRLELPEPGGTHDAYHYTGTFTATLGGYDPETGRNTLTHVENAEFDLWIDERGYPRRFDYRAANGVGESYEYHSFS